jgi:uncharacterized protein (DUF924 family)
MTGDAGPTPAAVLAFWRAAGPDKWFAKDAAFDAEIRTRFLAAWQAAAAGQLAAWEETAEGALALTIVLDQFPRNMFRGDARTYQEDATARALAGRAIARGFDLAVPHDERRFFYLPFQHSETLADQEHCVALAQRYGDEEFLRHALQHADIVRRFGRFPHRNALLGRVMTAEEQAFLDGGGFRG